MYRGGWAAVAAGLYVLSLAAGIGLALGRRAPAAVPAMAPVAGIGLGTHTVASRPWAFVRLTPGAGRPWAGRLGADALNSLTVLLGGFSANAPSVLQAAFPGLAPAPAEHAPTGARAE